MSSSTSVLLKQRYDAFTTVAKRLFPNLDDCCLRLPRVIVPTSKRTKHDCSLLPSRKILVQQIDSDQEGQEAEEEEESRDHSETPEFRTLPKHLLEGGRTLIIKCKKGPRERRIRVEDISEVLVELEDGTLFVEEDKDE